MKIVLSLILINSLLFGVVLEISRSVKHWERVYGNYEADSANAIVNSDNGFILAGKSGNAVYVIKIDKNGNKLWEKKYKNIGYFNIKAIIKSQDGFILTGMVESRGVGNSSMIVIKIDKKGNKLWEKRFGTGLNHDGANAIVNSDNGFIITGYSSTNEILVISIDKNGSLLWIKTYNGGYNFNSANAIVKSDDGFILAGNSGRYTYILKIDNNGNKLWQKIYEGEGYNTHSRANAIIKSDYGFILAGEIHNDFESNMYVIKIDNNGNKLWQKIYGGYRTNAIIKSDNGFILAGEIHNDFESNMYVVKIDNNGNKLWQKTYGAYSTNAIIQNDDGFILVGGIYDRNDNICLIGVFKDNIELGEAMQKYINSKLASIKPKIVKLKKKEFETSKEFHHRITIAQKKYKKEILVYKKKVKNTSKLYQYNAMKYAIERIWGKPIINNLLYNTDNCQFVAELFFENKENFNQKVVLKVPLKIAKGFKSLFHNLIPRAVFIIEKNKVVLQEIKIRYKNKDYIGNIINENGN